MSGEHLQIAIDGPSGSGKSTAAKAIARKLNIIYMDTGAMYRAVGLNVIRHEVDLDDREGICHVLGDTIIDVALVDGVQKVYLNGEDVSELIRTPEISQAASSVSAVLDVRLAMVALQQRLAGAQSVVMDGRDIGTHVLPMAPVKIFLTASDDERVNRRWLELNNKGQKIDVATVASEMKTRDDRDKGREHAPLRMAEDAHLVDTTGKSIDRVIEECIDIVRDYMTSKINY